MSWDQIDEARGLRKRIAELETELRFIETNLRQIDAAYDDGRVMPPDVLAGACLGWAMRISKLLVTAGLAAIMLTSMLGETRAQISPSWQSSPVLKGPKSPSPADLFRHHCRPGFAYNVRYRRCMPTRRGPWRTQ